MNILHITPSSNGYESVRLLANRVSRQNQLAVIEKDGEILMTGGYLINDTSQIRGILDSMSPSDQYEFIKSIKDNPFASLYYEEDPDVALTS